MTIGLCLIATGKYDVFLQPLIDSIDKFFFRHDSVIIYLFSDKYHLPKKSDRIQVINIEIEHKPFPYTTLYRYKYFSQASLMIDCEYLFYSDVDMRFVGSVDREILGDIVCVQHPGFYKGGWGSEGCDVRSHAYLPPDKWNGYKAGGFQGGKMSKYLDACSILSTMISDDESRGVMAQWHDETHWNWYLQTIAKDIKVLDPSYCYPESWHLPFPKRLLALDKNHAEIRK